MAEIVWTRQAVEDLDAVPASVQERILQRIELLADFPLMGPPMVAAYTGFRQLVVGRYRVIYDHAEGTVRIAYIRQGARQLGLRLVRPPDDED